MELDLPSCKHCHSTILLRKWLISWLSVVHISTAEIVSVLLHVVAPGDVIGSSLPSEQRSGRSSRLTRMFLLHQHQDGRNRGTQRRQQHIGSHLDTSDPNGVGKP